MPRSTCVEGSARLNDREASRIASLGEQNLAALIGEELRVRSHDAAFEKAVRTVGGAATAIRHTVGRRVQRGERSYVPACDMSSSCSYSDATALNLASILDHQSRISPDWVAITCGEAHYTYAQIAAYASQVAGGLAAMGIRPGEHVALSCPNVPWFPIAYFGNPESGRRRRPAERALQAP